MTWLLAAVVVAGYLEAAGAICGPRREATYFRVERRAEKETGQRFWLPPHEAV